VPARMEAVTTTYADNPPVGGSGLLGTVPLMTLSLRPRFRRSVVPSSEELWASAPPALAVFCDEGAPSPSSPS
jgi:hypothetical protein